MKKLSTVAMLLALFMAPVAMGATPEETTTDESQGLLINGFWDNWYISIDGGASVFFSPYDNELDFTKRIAPNAALNFGKWWTPVFGTRIGLDYMSVNGAALESSAWGYQADALVEGSNDLHTQKLHGLRPHLDGMVDLVNLFGGYSPTRVYSLVIYGGFGYGYGWAEGNAISDGKWATEIRGGLINSFHVSPQVDINIELKVSKYDSGLAQEGRGQQDWHNLNASASVGVAYKFRDRNWSAPVIPVVVPATCKYSDAEGDALVAQLRDANKRIKDLEQQLADCQTPVTQVVEEEPAVTVYFDINKSTVRSGDRKVLRAVAQAIKENPNTKYVVTGYADSQTGTPEFNAKLREARAKSVYNILVKSYGVNPDQLTTATDSQPLNKFNYVLDRAVTIKIAK